MIKNTVKITYAEPWLPFHHRLFINIVETCSARIALKKRYASYTDKVKNIIELNDFDDFENLNIEKQLTLITDII